MKYKPTLFLKGETSQTAKAFVAYAEGYAIASHGMQKRKYTGEPYVNHCIAVAETVASVSDDAEIIAAALLHDTLEDTSKTFTDLLLDFGPRVASLVLEVTDVSRLADGNRAARKKIDLYHLARTSAAAATIKLADMIDNSRSILAHDEGFARVYIPEKSAVLAVLQHGDKTLFNAADGILQDALLQLSIANAS